MQLSIYPLEGARSAYTNSCQSIFSQAGLDETCVHQFLYLFRDGSFITCKPGALIEPYDDAFPVAEGGSDLRCADINRCGIGIFQ